MKRSRYEIMFDILQVSTEGATKTKIVYAAYLNFKQADRYIDLLVEADFLALTEDGNKKVFKTTEKGMGLLNNFKGLLSEMSD